ncbi:hypothetical protein C8J56DRAFT_969788 [Mycena floridula]|nr:hypothetical protein C8J56DRAFT_969788 [Mycena floridula]
MFAKNILLALAAALMVAAGPSSLESRSAAAVAVAAGTASPDSAQVQLLVACLDVDFANCSSFNFGSVPTGCITVPTGFNDNISSASALAGVGCTLFTDPGCAGRSVFIKTDVSDLDPVGMNNAVSSLSCVGV